MDSRETRSRDLLGACLEGSAARLRQEFSMLEQTPSGQHLSQEIRSHAAILLEQAYDGLNRLHAILAYLNIMKRPVPGISQFLHEAKHTYEQALSHYGCGEFEGAKELGAASQGLSQVVEIIIA